MTVRYYLHLIRKDDGTGGVPSSRVTALLARMTSDFAPLGITLLEVGRSTINNTKWELYGSAPFDEVIQHNPHTNAIDIYLTSLPLPCVGDPPVEAVAQGKADATPGSALLLGYASRLDPQDEATRDEECFKAGQGVMGGLSDAVMVALSHEVGHTLGLFHTFHGTTEENNDPCQCSELVDGSNGYVCGDYVADTSADHRGAIVLNCVHQDTGQTDENGDPYDPPVSNIMSYYPAECQTGCTAGQASRMFTATLLQNARVVEEAEFPVDFPLLAGYETRLEDATMKFHTGTHLIVEGDLTAEGVTFTQVEAWQKWGGIEVYSGGSLDLDGVTVEHAEVGVYVFSDDVTITGSEIARNGTGIRSAYEQNYCPGLQACLIGDRSAFGVFDSQVIDNDYNGVQAVSTEADIQETTISGNGTSGLQVSDALVQLYPFNILEDNGASSDGHGIAVLAGGDVVMTEELEFARNRVKGNATSEVSVYNGGDAFIGSSTGNGQNAIYDPAGDKLVFNANPKHTISAVNTFWNSMGSPPTGAFYGDVAWNPVFECDYSPGGSGCLGMAGGRAESRSGLLGGWGTRAACARGRWSCC